MKRALILGGGGNVGIAWETAILAGLLDGGLDARDADLIVGTSAGSVVGMHLAHGRDPRELLREQRERPPPPLGAEAPRFDPAAIAEVWRVWGSFDEMAPEACAQVGRLSVAAPTMPEEEWLASFDQNGWPGWPARNVIVTAVNCDTGALFAITAADGIAPGRACAASCAVPGLFPPVTIGNACYADGGIRSGTSADLALSIAPDRVLIIAPLGTSDSGVQGIWKRQLAHEIAQLEASGASVTLVQMDEAATAAGATNLMDSALRIPTAAAGEAHGRKLAAALATWWID